MRHVARTNQLSTRRNILGRAEATFVRGRNKFERDSRYRTLMLRWMRLASRRRRGRPSILFEVDEGRGWGDSPGAIFAAIQAAYADDPRTPTMVWVRDGSVAQFPDDRTVVRRNSPKYFAALGRSTLWVTNQNLAFDVWPPADTFWLQTWHGTPLKRLGRDMAVISGREPQYLKRQLDNARKWSVLLTAGGWATERFRQAYDFDGDVWEIGLPRNDQLVGPDRGKAALRSAFNIASEERVAVFAPTFRDDQKERGSFSFGGVDDLNRMAEELPDGWILLVRAHPIISHAPELRNLPPLRSSGAKVRNASSHPDMAELLAVSDAVITDYSSVMFDCAAADIPVVLFMPDLDSYANRGRGLYFDPIDIPPGRIAETVADVGTELRSVAEGNDGFVATRAAFAERFCREDRGDATSQVLERLWELAVLPHPAKPTDGDGPAASD